MSSLPMCSFTAQLIEHRTSVAEVTGSNPVEVLIFFSLLPSNCLKWKIYCDDYCSLSSRAAVQIWISHIFHNIFHHMLTSSKQQQNKSFHVVERTRTSAKCPKMKNARAKRAKLFFSIFKYANLRRSCCRRRRGCLSSLFTLESIPVTNGLTYRIYSNKHRRAYLIFRATSAELIRGQRLFKYCTRQTYFFYIFIERYTFYLLIFLWTDSKLIVNLELREKFTRWKNPRVSW